MIPEAVKTWILSNGFGEVTITRSVGGGCINNGSLLKTTMGHSFFLKTNPRAPQDMFACEAEGLVALKVEGGPAVPAPYINGTDFLLLEDVSPAPLRPDYWITFGQQLAVVHSQTQKQFGFQQDNYIGSTPQPNTRMPDGYTFFAEQRLLFQARLALTRGLLGTSELRQVERLAARLPDLVPQQPASLIHGDLWGGNAISDARGGPAIIDPATHYGWAEAELAMTTLFGSFPEAFYSAYQEVRPLEKGFWARFPIYNLYHLLNHLNLFGGSYSGQVRAILQRFT